MRQAAVIGGLSAAGLAVVCVASGARAQEDLYRSVAYDDPYFTKAAPPEATPTFVRPTRTAPPERPRPPAPSGGVQPLPSIASAARPPAMPQRSARAAAAPRPRRAAPSGQAEATAQPGRIMRGRIEGVFGWERLRAEAPTDAVVFGAAVGADRKVGSLAGGALFLGPYGAARFSDAERSSTARTETTNGTETVVTETADTLAEEREVELGLRLGWATDRTALYASAGYINARAEAVRTVSVTTTDTAAMTETDETDEAETTVHRDGWRLGAGTEITLSGDFFWKADYGYTAFEEDADRHQVTTGVGLRF